MLFVSLEIRTQGVNKDVFYSYVFMLVVRILISFFVPKGSYKYSSARIQSFVGDLLKLE